MAIQLCSPLMHSVDVATPAESAFALVCEIEKWPVWLSFLQSARMADPRQPLGIGSEVIVRSKIPGESEQLFEVDGFIDNHMLSLVGAYSLRRRLNFRIERKTTISRIVAKVEYPAYGGKLAGLFDGLTARRKLATALAESMIHFKGLAEFDRSPESLLADF